MQKTGRKRDSEDVRGDVGMKDIRNLSDSEQMAWQRQVIREEARDEIEQQRSVIDIPRRA